MKTSIYIIALFFVSSLMMLKTSAQSKLEKAKEYNDNYQYSKAVALYEELSEKKNIRKPEVIRDIAHSYLMMNDAETAQLWLSKINSFTVYSPGELLNYANALKTSADYDNAIVQFKRFADFFPDLSYDVPQWIQSCEDAKVWMKNPKLYDVVNMENVNSEFSEFGVIPYHDGFLVASDRRDPGKNYETNEIFGWTGNPYLKFHTIPQLKENDSKAPELITNINSAYHNGPGVFDDNSDILYFTKTTMQKVKASPVNSNPTEFDLDETTESYINRLEIFSIRYRNGKWEEEMPFQFNDVEEYSVGHPALSPDGNTLYFSSDMPGGLGKSDIWYCKKNTDGTWSKPVNAGKIVNTSGKEVFPVVDQLGNLYFSSDGQPGMGGLDIFVSRGMYNNWTVPENMQFPINSPKDDFLPYFTEPGVMGYLASNRDGGKGGDDIYFFSKDVMLIVRTFEKSKENKLTPLSLVGVNIENLVNDNTFDVISNENGTVSQRFRCGSVLDVKGKKDGYLEQEKAVNVYCSSGYDSVFVDLIFDKIELNKTFVLDNIYYDFDKWNIRPDAAEELDKLVKILNDHPEIDIELSSHTDSRGTNKYNETLSQHRAESAVEYIISRGIDDSRITAKGYGENKLRVNCPDGVNCSDEEHQLNRRTEFTITNIRN